MAVHPTQCPLCPAGSTGRRNTGIKSLCWGFKLQGLTWPFVELTSHFVQIGLRMHRGHMQWREFITLLCGAAPTWPVPTPPHQPVMPAALGAATKPDVPAAFQGPPETSRPKSIWPRSSTVPGVSLTKRWNRSRAEKHKSGQRAAPVVVSEGLPAGGGVRSSAIDPGVPLVPGLLATCSVLHVPHP